MGKYIQQYGRAQRYGKSMFVYYNVAMHLSVNRDNRAAIMTVDTDRTAAAMSELYPHIILNKSKYYLIARFPNCKA